MVFACGTALRIVPLGVLGVAADFGVFGLVLHTLFLLPIQLFCLSLMSFGCLMASWAMNGGLGSGVSVPFLLKMERLRLTWLGDLAIELLTTGSAVVASTNVA